MIHLLVLKILKNKFPTAQTAFLAGSHTRKQATKYSDLDLVVIYEKLANAYRESFMFEGYPVEASMYDMRCERHFDPFLISNFFNIKVRDKKVNSIVKIDN